MPSTTSYLLIGLVAAVATFAFTPLVGVIARRLGWVVEPDERRIHKVATPDVGGIAMFIGLVAALAAARLNNNFDTIFARNDEPRGVLLGASLMFMIGLWDDIREISAPAKVIGTIAVAGVLTYYGVTMFYFRVPFVDVFTISDDWTLLVTVVWLLGMTQAINLIDGLDGLAAGIVAIGALAFFIYSLRLGDPTVNLLSFPTIGPLIAIITVGICVGFLPHNFNPAKIFMGDGGALLLGLLLAVSTSVVGGRADPNLQGYAGQTYFFLAPLFIPLFILGVPILDTLFAIVRRADPAPRRGDGRQEAPSPQAHGDGARSTAQRRDPVGVDCSAVRVRAVPGVDAELRVVRADRCCNAGAAVVHTLPPADPSQPRHLNPKSTCLFRFRLARQAVSDRLCMRSQALHIGVTSTSTPTPTGIEEPHR